MFLDGSRHTVESRPQVNTPGDRSKNDGSSISDFLPLLSLMLSVPAPPNNAAISDNGRVAGLNQAVPIADSQISESMHSDGAVIGGENGVSAENQPAAANAQYASMTDSAPSYPGVLSDQPLAAEIKPELNGIPGSMVQSATGRDGISRSRVMSESQAITNLVASPQGRLSDQPLAANSHVKRSDHPSGIFQPVTDGNEEPAPAPNSGPNIPLEQTAAAAKFPLITNSVPSYPRVLSDQPLAAEIKPELNGIPGSVVQSATGRDEISHSRVADKNQAITNFVASPQGISSIQPLAADNNAKPSDRPSGIFQPLTNGNEEPAPAQNPDPIIHLEQAAAAGEAAQADVPVTRPSEVVDKSNITSYLQNSAVGLDPKKLLVASDPEAVKARKVSIAPMEGVRGKSAVQSGEAVTRDPMVAQNNLDDVGTDSADDHSQNRLAPKEGQQLYSGNSASAKTSNGEFNTLIGDKTAHEAVEISGNGVQRSSETVTFGVTPTVLHEVAPAAADAPANVWRPVVEQVAGEMAGRIKFNKQDAIIQLDPPELGKIKIDLHVDGDKLQARIFTEGHESQSLVENHIQELRQALQANNLDLVDVRVQGGWHGASGDAMHGFPQQQQQQPSPQQEWGWASGNIADGDAVEALPSKTLTPDKGRVSMWA